MRSRLASGRPHRPRHPPEVETAMTPRFLRRSEARMTAEHLARAEAWVDQVAPELQSDIARIRAQLLQRAGYTLEPGLPDPRPHTA